MPFKGESDFSVLINLSILAYLADDAIRIPPDYEKDLVMSLAAAQHLMKALDANQGTTPVRDLLPADDYQAAYETQAAFNQLRLERGQRMIGRKAGFTNPTAQAAMGVTFPVAGVLFDVMDIPHNGEIAADKVTAPKIEAEIAFIMGVDLDHENISTADVMRAIDYVVPAIEIANTRIADWNVTGVDAIADNISASQFVIGHKAQTLDQFDVTTARADIHVDGESVAQGAAANVLGSPLNSLKWLANQLVAMNVPIQEGDIILSGSLGPMVPVAKGSQVDVFIEGAGSVSVSFAADA